MNNTIINCSIYIAKVELINASISLFYSDEIVEDFEMSENTKPILRNSSEQPIHINISKNQEANSLLHAEAQNLRKQCATVQDELGNLNRQLETSALNVTELEQKVLQEEFNSNTLKDALKSANMRIRLLNEEEKKSLDNFQKERQKIASNFNKSLNDKETVINEITADRDRTKSQLRSEHDAHHGLKVQMDELSKKHDSEEDTFQSELSRLHTQVTELAMSESRLKSESTMLKNKLQRGEQQIKQFETELSATRTEMEAKLLKEEKNRDTIVDTINKDHNDQVGTITERCNKQSAELGVLYKKIADLQISSSTLEADMEIKCDTAVVKAHEEEARRNESVVSDLREKIKLFITSRDEMQSRCDSLLKELEYSAQEHSKLNDCLELQIKSTETEMMRLTDKNHELREEMSVVSCKAQREGTELGEIKVRYNASEEKISTLSLRLKEASASEIELKTKLMDWNGNLLKKEKERKEHFFNFTEKLKQLELQTEMNIETTGNQTK